MQELLSELRVHQIELEMQNEELRRTQLELQNQRARYFDLYDLAPVGYCTVSAEGFILEANLIAAGLLGIPRSALVTQRFSRFIDLADADTYHLRCKQLLETGQAQSFELQITQGQSEPFWAHLAVTLAHSDGLDVMRVVVSDVSERKRSELALRVSQSELKKAQHLAGLGNWHWDFTSEVHTWSEEIFANYGMPTPCEPVSYPAIQKHFTVASWAELDAAVGNCRANGVPYRCDAEVVWSDGSHHWVAIIGNAIRDRDGNITALYGTLQDITERKHAALELRRSEAQLDCILQSTSDGILAIDSDGKVIRFNKQFGEMWKIPLSLLDSNDDPALLQHVVGQLAQPEAFLASVQALYASDTKLTDHLTFKDGRVFERFTSPLWMDARNIGRIWSFRDISERSRTEQALRESKELLQWTEESFRLMVESVSDCAITMLDPQGHIVSWNSGAQRIMGWSAKEIIGKHFARFHLLEDMDAGKPQQELDIAKATGQFETNGLRVRMDGSTFWAHVIFTAVRDQAGNLRGFAKLTRDLTETRRQHQLLHEKNMELATAWSVADAANRAKSEFLSSMSHELRTPLNGILGFAQLIDTGTPPPTPGQKRCLDQILKGGWYLLELINEILDLALVESGRLSLSLEPVSLVEIQLDCQSLIEPLARKSNIAITFSHLELPYFAHVDRTRVKQVLINLLSNAIKYNIAGGWVSVECSLNLPDHVRISVRDSGMGMTPEQLAQMFQPFNRLGKEFGPEVGTGIGLVVTKRLVELMGGVIGVESAVGAGSVFWVDLPLAVEPQIALSQGAGAIPIRAHGPASIPQRTLLYVEDNPANLELVKQLVERREGLRMLSAADGNLGIDYARTFQPDVILMDINLPGMSGLDAMKILQADPSTKHIRIIAISANAMPEDIEHALASGFFRYLTKPFKINDFMQALDLALACASCDIAGRGDSTRCATRPGIT